MDLKLRPGTPEDAQTWGASATRPSAPCQGAQFPQDSPSRRAVGVLSMLLGHPGLYSVVAEVNGKVVGSNFLDERSTISGVGPVTVDPAVQNHGVGRVLMQDVMRRAAERGAPGIRLLQAATTIARCPCMPSSASRSATCSPHARRPAEGRDPGYQARRATSRYRGCTAVCRRVHGHDRAGEVRDALAQGTALVVEHDGRISGYATDLALFGHAVGESNEDLKALSWPPRPSAVPASWFPRRTPTCSGGAWNRVCGSCI